MTGTDTAGAPLDAYDVVVVGSGAGGLTAALVAARRGASVLIIEKSDTLGGTTARSGARMWVPLSRHALAHGVRDNPADVLRYLEHEAGDDFSPAMAKAYLENAPAMVAWLEDNTAVQFGLDTTYSPDYAPHAPGASPGGRTIYPLEIPSREIGGLWKSMAPFRIWGTFLGLQVGAGPEQEHFMKASRSLRSFAHVAGELTSHFIAMALHGRTHMLRDGNALIARLLVSAVDAGIDIITSARAVGIIRTAKGATAIRLERDGRSRVIGARRGIVLATGGIGHNADLQRSLYAHVARGSEHRSAAAPTVTGDGIELALKAGAALRGNGDLRNGAWAPMMTDPRTMGTDAHVPSFTRAVPGSVFVSCAGKRIGNEAEYYPHFQRLMLREAHKNGENCVEGFLVGDRRTLRRYGLGTAVIKPSPFPVWPHLKSGLLIRAETIAELSEKTGIEPDGLRQTIRQMNEYADTGVDAEFARGESPFFRRKHKNPFLGPISEPPFYAVHLVAGDIGSFAGIATDHNARVLDGDGRPIGGLYAVGNDMASALGGVYPGKGGTIGPAMTFGYVAARHLTSVGASVS